MTSKNKHEIITFKADKSLLAAMAGISNRSAFIRHAVLAALDHVCPLCRGSGILTPNQRQHWNSFAQNHEVTLCGDCQEAHLVCDEHAESDVHGD